MIRVLSLGLLLLLHSWAVAGEHVLVVHLPPRASEAAIANSVDYALRNRGWEVLESEGASFRAKLENCLVSIFPRGRQLILTDDCNVRSRGEIIWPNKIESRWVKYLRQDIDQSMASWSLAVDQGSEASESKESLAARLEKLDYLREQGLISQAEHAEQRKRVLDGI